MATIREGITNWFRPLPVDESQKRSDPLPGITPVSWETLNAVAVTPESALTLAPVYRAVTIITTAVSQLDLGVWKNGEELDTPTLLAQPDKDRSLGSFLKRTTICLATQGNAYWRIYRNAAGVVVQVEVLNPSLVAIRYDDNGKKTYDYNGYKTPVTLQASQVKHLRLMEVPGYDLGLGPIQAFREGFSGHLALRGYQDKFLSESGIPTGVLKTSEELDEEQVAEYQRRWMESQATRKVAVMSAGLEYQPVLISPHDALFVEQMQMSTTEVARLFGVPAHLLLAAVEGNSMTYTNLQDAYSDFVRFGLAEYLTAIEDAFTDLLPRGQSVRVKTEAWLRGNDKAKAEVARSNVEAGIWTPNEGRAYTGKGPVESGNALRPTKSTEGDANAAA